MPALWKQEVPLHPTFAAVNRCLKADWFLLPYELKLQRAHARALHSAGILTEAEARAVESGLGAIERETRPEVCPESDAEDIHTWVEGRLTDLAGAAGKKIHTARSRNDQVATLLVMWAIDAGTRCAERLRALVRVVCERAKEWSDLVFPLQTHTQFAAPGSVGFWVLRYAAAWDRARRRLESAVSEWRRWCPLGSGAVAGSSIAIDRRLQAEALGFDAPSPNALYSTTARDECLELLAVGAQIALHLQSFATDVIAFSQTPLGWTVYPAEFATGSSMMPNKVNPDGMELLRGEGALIAGAHGQAVLLIKGLPSGYNRDLQCIKPVVRDTVEKLDGMLELTQAFLSGLAFNGERLAASLAEGHLTATLGMEQKVKQGLPLREAHHAVAEEIRAGGVAMGEAGDATAYRTIGSASPAETRRIADEFLKSLEMWA